MGRGSGPGCRVLEPLAHACSPLGSDPWALPLLSTLPFFLRQVGGHSPQAH